MSFQRAREYWRKRWVRVVLALPVLAGSAYVEYRLANIPLPVEVEKAVGPVTASLLNQEELVVLDPFRENSQPTSELRKELFPPEEKTAGISILAHFGSARLSEANMQRLRRESESDPRRRPPPDESLQQIDYTTDAPDETKLQAPRDKSGESARPCSAAIALALADNTVPPKELHLFQPADPAAGDRTLEIRSVGADLVVQLSVIEAAPDATTGRNARSLGPGCSKTISVGEWERSFTGPTLLEVVVPAGQSFQIWFSPLPKQTPWSGTSGYFEPFNLIAIPPVSATRVDRIVHDSAASTMPSFRASSLAAKNSLLLKHLRIGAEDLQLDISGRAMVQENGEDKVTFDLVKWMKANPVIALLLTALEIGLVNWVRLSFKKLPESSQPAS